MRDWLIGERTLKNIKASAVSPGLRWSAHGRKTLLPRAAGGESRLWLIKWQRSHYGATPVGRARTHSSGTCWNVALWSVAESWLLQQCPLAKKLPQGTVARGSFSHLFATDTSSNLESAGSQFPVLEQLVLQPELAAQPSRSVPHSKLDLPGDCRQIEVQHIQMCVLPPKLKKADQTWSLFSSCSYCLVRDYCLPLHWAEIQTLLDRA